MLKTVQLSRHNPSSSWETARVVTVFVIQLLLFACSLPTLAQPAWTMKSQLETIPSSTVKRFSLTFSQGDKSLPSYAPESPPFGLVSEKEILIGDRLYFLTGWAHGAHTVLFRVFDPTSQSSLPICEKISEAEESDLRLEKNNLEIRIINSDDKLSEEWIRCEKQKTKKSKSQTKK
ncbi:MAG: hypothetical protein IPK68_04655 [Bdellovibrionales bacterium]|nr:hypothetical protein [Bdellovibrionales bacterium]